MDSGFKVWLPTLNVIEPKNGAASYLGNGYIQVHDKSSLTLDKNSVLYLGSHNEGLFEKASDASKTGENHFSIELETGSTLNVNLDDKNKIHVDHIVSKDHTHAVIGKVDATADSPWFDLASGSAGSNPDSASDAGVKLSLTDVVLKRVEDKLDHPTIEDQKLAGQDNMKALRKLLSTGKLASSSDSLKTLYDAVVLKNDAGSSTNGGAGSNGNVSGKAGDASTAVLTEQEFFNAMGALLTLGLYREEGWQDYRFTMDQNGVR